MNLQRFGGSALLAGGLGAMMLLAGCQAENTGLAASDSAQGPLAKPAVQGIICADHQVTGDTAIVGHIYGANSCAPSAMYDELTQYEFARLPAPSDPAKLDTICGDAIPQGWLVTAWDNSTYGCRDNYVTALPAIIVKNYTVQTAGTQLTQCTYTWLGDQAVPAGWSQVGSSFYASACRAGNDMNETEPNARTIQKNSGPVTLLNHSFGNLTGWLDVTTLKAFRGPGNSIFEAVSVTGAPNGGKAVVVKSALQGAYGANYPQKGAAAFDYKFATPIDRTKGTVTIEWAMKVESMNQNENNRFNVILLSNMNRKADLSTVDSYVEGPYTTASQEYGIPTYQVRVISDQVVSNGGIRLGYGQKIEKTSAGEYIPGFISPYSSNGGEGSWNNPNKFKLLRKTTSSLSSGFVTYKWVIDANWQYLYENGVLVKPTNSSQVDPPADGKVYAGPEASIPTSIKSYYPNYQYFRTLEGVRIYMRNGNSSSGTWISHIKVTQG